MMYLLEKCSIQPMKKLKQGGNMGMQRNYEPFMLSLEIDIG